MPELVPFPLDNRVIWNKLWQMSKARFGTLYRNELVNSDNVHLYTYANAVNVLANQNLSSINEIRVKNHDGKAHRVRANQYILACGAIQNARLLLASNSQVQNGLGNDNDLVGRYFMEHVEVTAGQLWLLNEFPTDLYVFGKDTRVRAELAITQEAQKEHRILNGTAGLRALSVARHLKPRIEILQEDDYDTAVENYRKNIEEAERSAALESAGSIARAFALQTRTEQAPNRNSRVTIESEMDALGVPRVHLHWELTELDKRTMRTISELIGQHAGMAALGRVRLSVFVRDPGGGFGSHGISGGWHHLGTTRMARNPKQGVVDANCQVHGIRNLHIAGSGCFCTSAAANPTLTIVALSLRLSDHVKRKLIRPS